MSIVKLKLANIDDLDLLAEMYNDLRIAEQSDTDMTKIEIKDQMRSFLQGEVYDTYLLIGNDIVYGYGMIDKTKSPMYLRHMFIRSEYRKQGYGKKLINMLLKHYKITDIDIEVFVWNKNAIEFYKKMGFISRCYSMRLSI